MKKEINNKIREALQNGRCLHKRRSSIMDNVNDVVIELKCKDCGMELTCKTCQYGQYRGDKNLYYCIKREESMMGSQTCLDWEWHRALPFTTSGRRL